jgi:hypothetical protein
VFVVCTTQRYVAGARAAGAAPQEVEVVRGRRRLRDDHVGGLPHTLVRAAGHGRGPTRPRLRVHELQVALDAGARVLGTHTVESCTSRARAKHESATGPRHHRER